ncbi:universal stress protein [Ramlibacter sp. MMS24-I3-19]|uniref:universal stress protein n=1 Tax=Ramlibacter sp. MMS24-I3-19 TaxID=3416606 RepID=UPI003D0738E0
MTADLRCIVVHLDGPERARERLLLGRKLAAAHGAQLRVHYAAVPTARLLPVESDSAPGVMDALLAIEDERRRQSREVFEDLVRQDGPAMTWSQSGDLEPGPEFARAAMYGDLMVLGQFDASARGPAMPEDFAATVLARSGRPALLVPWAGSVASAFATVAIAWKETPEAARAVVAALPFLHRAAVVHILAWGAEPEGGNLPRLAAYLALHGIHAERHHEPPAGARDVGEAMLSRCADLSADLLVMGCYGHGRAREWILGGASRTVLRSMTLPVLMAH